MPKLGMAGCSIMLADWFSALKTAVAHRFSAFEIFAEFPQCIPGEVPAEQRKEARAIVESTGIALAVHAPFTSLNIAALNPGIREESVRQYEQAIDLCADLGGSVVVIHPGKFVVSQEFLKKTPEAGRIQQEFNLESLRRISRRAAERGVLLALENTGFEPDAIDRSLEDLVRMREEVSEPSLAFCLDIGHARLAGELEKAPALLGDRIAHIHFTDNRGQKDDHLVIGEGDFDYRPLLDFLRNFPGIITLEVLAMGTDPAPALESRERVRNLLENPE